MPANAVPVEDKGAFYVDDAGLEMMCPQGHGSVYVSSSLLGADLSNRWIALEELSSKKTDAESAAL